MENIFETLSAAIKPNYDNEFTPEELRIIYSEQDKKNFELIEELKEIARTWSL